MKKTAAILIVLSMIFMLCACGEMGDTSETAPVPKFDVCVDFSTVETDEVWDEVSGDVIFTQSICVPAVTDAGNRDAVADINEDIQYRCELFREGAAAIRDSALSLADENAKLGDGAGADSSGLVLNHQLPSRYNETALLTRGDIGVISISYDVFTYSSGAAHGYIARDSVSYDAKTGKKLSLDSISEEPELLKQLIYGYILNISAGEKYSDENGVSIFLTETLADDLAVLITTDQWYFSNEGLVFFANPYELASYAYGRVDFTVPYAAMDGLLKEEYLPTALEGENGMILAQSGDETDTESLELIGSITLDEEGQSVILTAEDTLYRVELTQKNDYSSAEKTLWYRSYMTTDEALELLLFIPDVLPDVVLRYTMADGTVIERGISQSGEDGSIILTEITAE